MGDLLSVMFPQNGEAKKVFYIKIYQSVASKDSKSRRAMCYNSCKYFVSAIKLGVFWVVS